MSEAKKKTHEEIVERIKKFLAMTVERGAGEAEAIFAARKAAELMAEYDISLADLADKPQSNEAIYKSHVFDPEFTRAVYSIVKAISDLCRVKILIIGPLSGKVSIVGMEIDVAIAEYLLNVCTSAMRHEVDKASKAWMLQMKLMPRRRASFLQGMAERLDERLKELAWARSKTGNALVVVTDKVVKDVLAKRGGKMKRGSNRGRSADDGSLADGRRAGSMISLNNALHGRRSGADASISEDHEGNGKSEA
jgi:hypothetical protein